MEGLQMKADRMRAIYFLTLILLLVVGRAFGAEEAKKMTVDEAVSIALEENLNLKLQKSEVERVQGAELVEKGIFDPQVEAGIAGQEQRMTSLLVGGADEEKSAIWNASVKKKLTTGTDVALSWENGRYDTDSDLIALNPSYSSAIGLSISQPLMRGNSKEIQTAGVRATEKITQAATYLVADQAASLSAQVKKAYWELVFARQDIDVKKLSLKLAVNLREEISRKIESGVLAEVEIYQPESEIARREELLIAAERNIANTEDALKLLLNSRRWNVSVIPVDTPEMLSQKPNLQTVLKNALSKRSDIMAGDLQVDAARIMVSKAKDDLKPYLALEGLTGVKGIGDDYGESLDSTFSDGDFSWQVGLTLQVPFGNSTSRGGLAKAKADLEKARLRAELLRQQTIRNAREAVRNVILAKKTIEATRKTGLAAQKRLEAEQEKFKVGMATANNVLESQDIYAQALAGEKRALVDLARARAELDRVQGIVSFRNLTNG
jgi:outer membrane protein TolC